MARAFGKVIFFGEHAVVHDRMAVAAALDRGARATATRIDGDRSTLELAPWGRQLRDDDPSDEVSRAFAALLREVVGRGAVRAHVDVEIPGGAGLGCSAAIGVALARAVAAARDEAMHDADVERAAGAWEQVFHGAPSGVDVAVASRGGLIAFRKGTPPRPVCPPSMIELAIASTGEPASTRAMVEQVARQLARRPQVVNRTFDGIDTLAIKGIGAIEAGRWYEVGRLMDLNHALLASLMLSTEALEKACSVARAAGALGAKLTGGGGGGCAMAIAPGTSDAVVEAWKSHGIEGFTARIEAKVAIVGSLESPS